MQNQAQRRPEQRIADDLGLTLDELTAVVKQERAVQRARRLVQALRDLVEEARDLAADQVDRLVCDDDWDTLGDADALLAEIDAPIGGAS